MPHSEQGERLKVEFHISTRWGIGPSTVCFIRSAFCYLYDEGTGLRQGHSVFIYLFMFCSGVCYYSQAAYSDSFCNTTAAMALNITDNLILMLSPLCIAFTPCSLALNGISL